MDKNQNSGQDKEHIPFPAPDAPLKNTDDAFVQVGEDGSPFIPETEEEEGDSLRERTSDLDHR